jgi:hypothetical protein
MLDRFPCSFIPTIFVTTSCSFTNVKEQLVVTKAVGINEDESLSNITLRNQY